MDIKQFAFRMQKATGASRGHCYEVLAAYLGYGSYAAYQNSAHPPKDPGIYKAKQRCEELGLDASVAVYLIENIGEAR